MENLNYKFQEKKDESFKELLKAQVNIFCKRIAIHEQFGNLSDGDKKLLNVFGYECIMNIVWYKRHIWKEQFWRVIYFSISLLLLLGIPILIWYITFEYAPKIDNLKSGETIIGVVTILLTSILAIHKFVTAWLEKRKFLSQFYSAFTELKNILFRLENDWKNGIAYDISSNKLSEDFKNALNQAITDSRKIVTEETKQYFETLSYPNIDIYSLLSNSSTSAISLINSFKSKKWNLEKLKEEVETSQIDKIKEEQKIKELEIKINIKKEKVAALRIQYDSKSKYFIEKSKIENKTELDKQEIKQLDTDIKLILPKISSLEIEIIEIESELAIKKMNKNAT